MRNIKHRRSDRPDRVIAAGPYDNVHQSVPRHILSEAEYDRIKDDVTPSH